MTRHPRLPDGAALRLHDLWMEVLRHRGGPVPRQQLNEAAIVVATEARAAAVLPEELLVAVKQSWAALPELRALEERHNAQATLTDFVSICISEFFQAGGGAAVPNTERATSDAGMRAQR